MSMNRRQALAGLAFLPSFGMAHAQTPLVIDPAGGDFTSLLAFEAWINGAGSDVSALVRRADYDPDRFSPGFFSHHLDLEFEAGCRIISAPGISQNGLHMGTGGSLKARGNGCLIDGFNTGTGNGISGYAATVDVSDFRIRNVRDGFSLHHVSDRGIARRIDVRGATKYAVAHVGQSRSLHADCYFEPANGAAGIAHVIDGEHDFVSSTLMPSPDGMVNSIAASPGVTFLRCHLGSAASPVVITGNPVIADCWVNGEFVS
jgi:hypothetical protein